MGNQENWERFERERNLYQMNQYTPLFTEQDVKAVKDVVNKAVSFYRRIHSFVAGLPMRAKWFFQRRTRGFSDPEIWDLSTHLVREIYPRLKFFTTWQSEHGKALPVEFADDPAGWLNVLNKILRAFELMASDEHLFGLSSNRYPYSQEVTTDAARALIRYTDEHQEELREIELGLMLFARHFRDLRD